MNVTSIEWTDFSANPLKYRTADGRVVWGCVRASPGCVHCYSETLATRWNKGGPFNVPTMNGLTPFLDDAELHHMITAKQIGWRPVAGSRCFVGDMTDIFGEWVSDELLDRLFAVFALRPDVTWQVLTKRADRMRAYFNAVEFRQEMIGIEAEYRSGLDRFIDQRPRWCLPLPNVWLGVSAEDQQRADERIPHLLQTQAEVRFVSAEPLIGPVDLSFAPWLEDRAKFPETDDISDGRDALRLINGTRIDWVIVGGESGHGARPCHVSWIRSVVEQCHASGVPAFVKQVGSAPTLSGPCALDEWTNPARVTAESGGTRIVLRDRKGGDPSEWPLALRVRQFPGEVRA